MVRFFISLVVVALTLPSCLQLATPLSQRRGDGTGRDADGLGASANPNDMTPGGEDGSSEEAPSAVFISGVEFPGTEQERMVIFKDGSRIKEFSTDVRNGSCSDADTHFLFSDGLYTTATWRENTIVAFNGTPLFTFEGKEYICDLLKTREGVWTLGNNRSGSGFALRLDGIARYQSGSGTARGLHYDSGHMYFIYETSIGDTQLIYLVEDASAHGLSPRFGTRVLDAVVCEGHMWLLETTAAGWTVSSGEERYDYGKRAGFGFGAGRLYRRPEGRCAAIISLIAPGSGMPLDLICEDGEELLRGGGSGAYHYYDGSVPVHVAFSRDMGQLSIYRAGEDVRLDSTRIASMRCGCARRGSFMLACYPYPDGQAFVWNDGEVQELDLEGYPTALCISPPS